MPQRILDLAALPVLDVQRVLLATVDQFRPTLLVFSWRDIQIYAPVDGRGGNPLQNSFEVFYARNPLKRLHGALGGLRLMTSHYGEQPNPGCVAASPENTCANDLPDKPGRSEKWGCTAAALAAPVPVVETKRLQRGIWDANKRIR